MKRIFWAEDQKLKVLSRAVDLKRSRQINLLEALKLAQQEVLPKELHRPFKTHAGAVALTKRLNRMLLAPTPAVQPAAEPKPVEPPKPPSTFEELISKLAESFAEELAKKLQAALRSRLAAVVETSRLAVINAATAPGQRKKVLVVGTKGNQKFLLAQDYGKLLDLRFCDTGTPAQQLASSANDVAVVLLWADFVSHQTQEALPASKTVLVRGGMAALKEKLEEIYLT